MRKPQGSSDIWHEITITTSFPAEMVSRLESQHGPEVAHAALDAWASLAERGLLLQRFGV